MAAERGSPGERRWRPNLAVSFCAIAALAVCVGLGFWQLERGADKARLEQSQLDRISALSVQARPELSERHFLRVHLRGGYAPDEYFLVDNQVVNQVAGYWVVQRFDAIDGRRWLVNRGWVGGATQRGELPEVAQPSGYDLRIQGVFWPDLGMLPMFGDEVWDPGWPKRIPRMNVARMASEVAAQPVEIRLEAGQPGRLGPLPMNLGMRARVHRGYAVQWFGLALVVAAGYVVHGYRRRATTQGLR